MEGDGGNSEQLGGGRLEGVGVKNQPQSPESSDSISVKTEILEKPEGPQATQQQDGISPQDTKVKETSSNQPFNMLQALQQEFELTPEQLSRLKEIAVKEGINLENFSEEDLGNLDKMKRILDLLNSKGINLRPKQKEILTQNEQTLQQVDQPLTEEQMEAKINEEKQKLQSRTEKLQQKQQSGQVLTDEEEKELNTIQQAIDVLTQMESQAGQLSADQSPQAKTQRKQVLLERASTYFKYAGFGLAALFFIFAWKGLTSEMGGQRGGMMG